MSEDQTPPSVISLAYKAVGNTHVFYAPDYRGYYIGSSSLRTAYDSAEAALGEHITRLYGVTVEYQMSGDFESFEKSIVARGA